MKWFLLKADPDTDYSIDDLAKDGETIWDGVHNYQAINFIKTMLPGDKIFIYHSQKQRKIVGEAKVAEEPYKNEEDARFSWAVKIEFSKKYQKTLSLDEIKADPINNNFLLVRNSRLSVMPVPDKIVERISSKIS
jgi:predicted RNA-binding protein with PUA-like domain